MGRRATRVGVGENVRSEKLNWQMFPVSANYSRKGEEKNRKSGFKIQNQGHQRFAHTIYFPCVSTNLEIHKYEGRFWRFLI